MLYKLGDQNKHVLALGLYQMMVLKIIPTFVTEVGVSAFESHVRARGPPPPPIGNAMRYPSCGIYAVSANQSHTSSIKGSGMDC